MSLLTFCTFCYRPRHTYRCHGPVRSPLHRRPLTAALTTALMAALAAASLPALAAAEGLRADISGFGTLGGGDTTGAGDLPESEYDWERKNILGLQMNLTSPSGLGLTVQGVMRGYSRTGEPPYKPDT